MWAVQGRRHLAPRHNASLRHSCQQCHGRPAVCVTLSRCCTSVNACGGTCRRHPLTCIQFHVRTRCMRPMPKGMRHLQACHNNSAAAVRLQVVRELQLEALPGAVKPQGHQPRERRQQRRRQRRRRPRAARARAQQRPHRQWRRRGADVGRSRSADAARRDAPAAGGPCVRRCAFAAGMVGGT